jgi:hypothetical protein
MLAVNSSTTVRQIPNIFEYLAYFQPSQWISRKLKM